MIHETDFCCEKLNTALQKEEAFIHRMGITTLEDLGKCIESGGTEELIASCELRLDKALGHIAEQIRDRSDSVRVIGVAGPSSSGKTTFANRLDSELEKMGIICHVISTDDYFIPDEALTKTDDLDWESLDIVDTALFDAHMKALVKGEAVELPRYNFLNNKREWSGEQLRLEENHVVLVEGIHALNPKLAPSIQKDTMFKIYISALTRLMGDDGHHLSPSLFRLVRRMVRDYNFRGASAEATLERWHSVRMGEIKNIFPFIEEADVVFNSTLVYEHAVLKPFAEAVLPPDEKHEETGKIRELMAKLPVISPELVPKRSILREFFPNS